MLIHIFQTHRKLKDIHQNVNALTHFEKDNSKWDKYQYTLSTQESWLGSLTIIAWWSQTQSEESGSEAPECAGICSGGQMAHLSIRDTSAKWPRAHTGESGPFPLWTAGNHTAKHSSPVSFLLCLSTPNPFSDWHTLSLDMLIWSIRLLKSPCTLCF